MRASQRDVAANPMERPTGARHQGRRSRLRARGASVPTLRSGELSPGAYCTVHPFPKRRLAFAALCCLLSVGGSLAAAGASTRALVSPAEEPGTTRLIYLVSDCEGCKLWLVGFDGDGHGWGTPPIDINEGRAEVVIDTALTPGLVTLVVPPWDNKGGRQGTPTIAMRYNKQAVGSRVTNRRARSRTRGTGCWAGTDASRHRFHIIVRRVQLPDGVSTLAFARTTQAWTKPMAPAPHGRLRTVSPAPCTLP